MSDNSNTGVPEDEKETNDLLALLYPEEGSELEDSELVSDEELLGLQGLRSLFREMPEEEPSDAVTNKLLAMAAQHAPKPQEESRGFFGWLSDVLMPVMSHPGLAAAATLVLVVGVAGTLYVKGGAEMAEPQVSSRSEAPESPAAIPEVTADTSTLARGATETPEEAQPSDDPAAAEPEPDTLADESSDGLVGGLLGERKRESTNANKEDFKSTTATGKGSKVPEPSKKRKSKDSVAGGDFGEFGDSTSGYGGGGGVSLGGASTSEGSSPPVAEPARKGAESRSDQSNAPVQKQAPSKPKPAPNPKSAPAPSTRAQAEQRPEPPPPPAGELADSEEDDDEAADKAKEATSNKSQAAALHQKAIEAAKKNDCKSVLSLGDQIRKLDSAYYDRTFLSDSRLKACRAVRK